VSAESHEPHDLVIHIMIETSRCSVCGKATPQTLLAEAQWYPFWEQEGGGCPACVQEQLLRNLLAGGDATLHEAIQTVWPLDAEAAFGVLPTRLRLHADPRFSGDGVTLALIDSGFYPHPDLVQPTNRIRVWVDASCEPIRVLRFGATETPTWPEWDGAHDWQWHGTMTSVVAAGNGFLSHGLYSSLARGAELVLMQVRDSSGHISSASILRALNWLLRNGTELRVRVVSMSVSGDPVSPLRGNPVDEAVAALVDSGITVVTAAGNDGERRLLPPATAPMAITVGGIDDNNVFNHEEVAIWHSNYGNASNDVPKPELVAPSIWVAAPVLPSTTLATEARALFMQRAKKDAGIERRIAELKLITPHYQHAEGTSFAAPIVASAIACLLEANPDLTPRLVRDILLDTAHPISGADRLRQGAGALSPGEATARALAEIHGNAASQTTPRVSEDGLIFSLHDHEASTVHVFGSWDNWTGPGLAAAEVESGLWQTSPARLPPGQHAYKFLLNGERWLDDPANPRKTHDGAGGLNSLCSVPESPGPFQGDEGGHGQAQANLSY
jgi:serine protease AprX